jgi:site-specific DNA-cytosine methylase
MLEAHVLAAATGFSKRYDFKGTKAEVNRQIGNAVPVGLATELIGAMLSENAR